MDNLTALEKLQPALEESRTMLDGIVKAEDRMHVKTLAMCMSTIVSSQILIVKVLISLLRS